MPVVLPDRFAAGSPVVEDRVRGFGQWRYFLGGADTLVDRLWRLCVADRTYPWLLAGLVYHLFLSGTGAEKKFRFISQGALVPQCVSRISVRGLFYFGYSGFVYHVAELQYASYAAWVR